MLSGNGRRVAAAVTLAIVSAAFTVALAQPRRPSPRPKPRPTADASADTTPDEDTLGGSADAGSVPAPVAPPSGGDGGVKASPLNPAPNEFPPQTAGDAGPSAADYDRLLGDIAALRARASAVGDALFKSRLGIQVTADSDHEKIFRLTVALDDGVVYTSPQGFGGGATPVYNHAVAPGRHAITLDVERRDDRNDAFRTQQRSRFIVEVPKDQELSVDVQIDDDSSMGGDFPSDRSGKYDLRFRVKAQARPARK